MRSRGGAIACDKLAKELSVKDNGKTTQLKFSWQSCCKFVEDGDSLIIDSGTTTEEVAKALTSKKALTMTNGLNIAHVLADIDDANVFMLGGQLHKKSCFSPMRLSKHSLNTLQKGYFGVDGIDSEAGITTHYEPEAMLNRTMCTRADKVLR